MVFIFFFFILVLFITIFFCWINVMILNYYLTTIICIYVFVIANACKDALIYTGYSVIANSNFKAAFSLTVPIYLNYFTIQTLV